MPLKLSSKNLKKKKVSDDILKTSSFKGPEQCDICDIFPISIRGIGHNRWVLFSKTVGSIVYISFAAAFLGKSTDEFNADRQGSICVWTNQIT